MKSNIEKAHVLAEALPYIRRFNGKTFVIKYGGSAMVNENLKSSFAADITLMKYVGINPVIVHGGGPQIGETLQKMGIKSEFHEGLRITNDETMEVVEMVLVGRVNKNIVSYINSHGGKAVGLSGKDGNLIHAEKIQLKSSKDRKLPPEIINLGKVGRVKKIETATVDVLVKEGFIPIIAPVGVGKDRDAYNINADTVAAEMAVALKAEKLILLTDVEGVKGAKNELVSSLNKDQADKMIESGVIQGGMIPKIESCLRALSGKVKKSHIIDGRVEHVLLLEIFTDSGIGTVIS